MTGSKYLKFLNPLALFNTKRTRDIFKVNPTITPERQEADTIVANIFDYTATEIHEFTYNTIEPCTRFNNNGHISWINIDGIRKKEVESICTHFGIHYLIIEDILSVGQRPKMDELNPVLYCLMNMLYFNEQTGTVETEQISILLGRDYVISFQEDASRDVFDPIREKLKIAESKLRLSGADYLCYAMIDMIVDNYYLVMDKIGDRIEMLEERIIRSSNKRSLAEINALRKELIVLKRNVSPVRDIVNGFVRTDSDLLDERTRKYFKDIYDHIVQANDLVESHRDMMINLHDLYVSNVNLKLNEVMKVMTIVTCLLAPATVIGGIFGMNFDVIPYAHESNGFYIATSLMILVPIIMVFIFRKRGWF